MPTLLKNMDIRFISLVKAGANRRRVLWKDDEENGVELTVPIVKTDKEKQLVYGIVYAPNDIDAHGDYSTEDEIEKAAHRFMKGLNLKNVDTSHDLNKVGAYVAESWIVKKKDPVFPNERPGAWAVAIKVEDPEVWKGVKDGKFEALSMWGYAEKVAEGATMKDADEMGETIVRKILNAVKALTAKGEDMNEDEVKKLVKEELKEFAKGLPKPLTKEDIAEVLKPVIAPITERLDTVEKATKGSKQDEKEPASEEDLSKLGDEIAKMVNGE